MEKVTDEGLRTKSERRKTLFYEALRNEEISKEKEENTHDEQVSLESAFIRFITAPHVESYYSLVPLVANMLDRVKPRCTETKLQKVFEKLLRVNRQSTKDIETLLDELEAYIGKLVFTEMQRLELDAAAALVQEVLGFYWAGQRHEYLHVEVANVKLTQSYVLSNLLGFHMAGNDDDYQDKWRTATLEYLRDLDHYHMKVIVALEETERELNTLYLTMKNIVTFKSLVILTIWRLNHNSKVSGSIVELLYPGAEKEEDPKWTLAYGTFFKDYQLFIHWHQRTFEGKAVQLNLLYIDFEASAASAAIPINIRNTNKDTYSSNTSFAGIFINHTDNLPLSYMLPEGDLLRAEKRKESVIVTKELKKSSGIRSMFSG